MGRLSYVNRKIEGMKLGAVVSRDLVKRVPPSTGSKAAFRDPVVELDVSGKGLTDEGLNEVALALEESLKYHSNQGKVVRLEELCLSNNGLSVLALQALTPVITLASCDLRDLDLSANNITVNTEAEVAVWESFLISFKSCCVLRRLDLSGNALGSRALEVLARVYAKEGVMDLLPPAHLVFDQSEERSPSVHLGRIQKTSIESDAENYHGGADTGPKVGKHKGSRLDSISSEKTDLKASQQDPLPIYTTAQGLRSIPYIVLSDTSMTETGALHLSYILACHTSPEFLLTRVPPAKAGPPAQQLTSYDGTDCRGIVYLPNSLLSNAGQKVLELAETIRDSHLDCVDNSMVEATSELSITPPKSSTASRRASGVRSVPTLGGRSRRRRSTASTGANNQDTLLGNELDRARSRIQCNALQDAGPQSNDLWRSALRMLSLARQIRPQTRKDLPPMKIKGPSVWTLDTTSINPRTLKSLTPLTLQRDSNQPISPRTIQFRKKSSSTPPTPAIIAPTHLSPNTCTHTPALAKETADYRTELPCGLPADVWRRILGFAAGANGIMSEVQQQSVLRWAMDRKTLSRESESLGLRESAQCWKILEATGCLAYEMG